MNLCFLGIVSNAFSLAVGSLIAYIMDYKYVIFQLLRMFD